MNEANILKKKPSKDNIFFSHLINIYEQKRLRFKSINYMIKKKQKKHKKTKKKFKRLQRVYIHIIFFIWTNSQTIYIVNSFKIQYELLT